MRIDIHNHTPLCNHATGTPSQYIQKAKELGIDIYGFACHAPMEFDKQYRMSKKQIPLYLQQIQDLKESTKDLEILVGFEVDFINGREDLLESCVLDSNVDYLIGSVHFLGEWGFDNPEFIGEYATRDLNECWKIYLESIRKMAESKQFQIVGHLDLLKVFGYKMPKSLDKELYATLEAIKDSQMSLEINSSGLRKKIQEMYPSDKILAIAYKMGIPITFSSDAHSVDNVGFGYEKCLKLAKSIGYKECVIYRQKQIQKIPLD